MVRYCNKALSMILFLYNLFYMLYTYGLHPNFVFTKYGRDTQWRWDAPGRYGHGEHTRGATSTRSVVAASSLWAITWVQKALLAGGGGHTERGGADG
jgi:hypothetical protein